MLHVLRVLQIQQNRLWTWLEGEDKENEEEEEEEASADHGDEEEEEETEEEEQDETAHCKKHARGALWGASLEGVRRNPPLSGTSRTTMCTRSQCLRGTAGVPISVLSPKQA